MAKQKQKQKPQASSARNWIVRIIIFGALGIFLVLALLDFNAKKQYTQTGQAWAKKMNDENKVNETETRLPLAVLEEMVVGSPEITKDKKEIVYTWNGIFRSYAATLTLDPFDDEIVTFIDGPKYEPEE